MCMWLGSQWRLALEGPIMRKFCKVFNTNTPKVLEVKK